MKHSEGFTCECGEYHTFPPYVYAHSREILIHSCTKCSRKHTIVMFHTTLIDIKKKKKKGKTK